MRKYLSLLFVALFLCGQFIHARSKEVNDYINQQIELILSETLANPSAYVAQKSQFIQLGNQKEQTNSAEKNNFFAVYIRRILPNFREGRMKSVRRDMGDDKLTINYKEDWKRKEIEELENYFQNIFPTRFEYIDRVASLRANQSISLTEDDNAKIDVALRDLLFEPNEIEIPGYAFMGETGDDGKLLYWATSNYSPSGKASKDIKPSSTTVKKDDVEYTIKQRIYYSLNETDEFSQPSEITPSKFTCVIEGNDYTFIPRLPSVNEVKKFVKTCTPSHHITHERSIYLNEVNMDKIFISSETNILEFITGVYWTSTPEWAYEFSVPGLDINTGEIPIEAIMVNIEEYNSNRKIQGESTVSPMARLVISVDEKLIESVRSQKFKKSEEELNNLLNGYESWGTSVSEENKKQLQPLMDFFNSIPQQITESNPFDYTLYKNILATRDRNNQPIERAGSEFYTLEITLNNNGQKLATEISSKYVQLKQTSDTDFSIKPYMGDIFEVFRNPLINTDNLPDGISELVQAITHCQQEIQKIALAFEIGIQNPWEKDIIDLTQQRYNINSASTYYKVGILPNYTLDLKQVFSLKFNQIENVIYFDNPFLKPLKKGATVFVVSFKAKSSNDSVNLIFNDKKVNVKYKNRYYREENGEVIFEK
ncbi:MAG: hypothetical protein HDR95_03785 [Bacteroides sp.]|nr:hypothetical protein [Bacteroides sp.]